MIYIAILGDSNMTSPNVHSRWSIQAKSILVHANKALGINLVKIKVFLSTLSIPVIGQEATSTS
jgi:hypothetical protein